LAHSKTDWRRVRGCDSVQVTYNTAPFKRALRPGMALVLILPRTLETILTSLIKTFAAHGYPSAPLSSISYGHRRALSTGINCSMGWATFLMD